MVLLQHVMRVLIQHVLLPLNTSARAILLGTNRMLALLRREPFVHVSQMSTMATHGTEKVLPTNRPQTEGTDDCRCCDSERRWRLTVVIDLRENLRSLVEVRASMEKTRIGVENGIVVVFVDQLRLDHRFEEGRLRHGQKKHAGRLNITVDRVISNEMFDQS